MRLVAMNVLGAKPDSMDGSSLGHPGKFTLLVAEEPPPAGWNPLRVELGYGLEDTTVTVLGTEGPHQVANHLNPDPEGILLTFAAAMRNPATYAVGKGHQVVIVLGHEHRSALAEAGWTRAMVREFLAEHSRVTPDELLAAGVLLLCARQSGSCLELWGAAACFALAMGGNGRVLAGVPAADVAPRVGCAVNG